MKITSFCNTMLNRERLKSEQEKQKQTAWKDNDGGYESEFRPREENEVPQDYHTHV